MPHDRYYLENALADGSEFSLDGEEFHHLSRVMRGAVGDEVECFNGRGVLVVATIISLEKKEAWLRVVKRSESPFPSSPLIIAQAYPRQNKLELVLEKGCELGMNEIWLFPGERSEKSDSSDNQKQRMHHILVSSAKQCGQLWVPTVKIMPLLSKWSKPEENAFFGDVREEAPLFAEAWKESDPSKGAIFFVGPEKGFSDKEHAKLEELGAVGVKLNNHILRTETAPLAALSLMSYWKM